MTSYERFGEFYDAIMGDRRAAAEQVMEFIRAAKPDAKNVLELGCGTGSMLKHLQNAYEVSGLDTSSKMLSIARKKVRRAKLFRQNMVDFQIDDRFDVILCVFDSINHVRRFSEWKKVFANARQHLTPAGCFIFDINTQRKLERHISEPQSNLPGLSSVSDTSATSGQAVTHAAQSGTAPVLKVTTRLVLRCGRHR